MLYLRKRPLVFRSSLDEALMILLPTRTGRNSCGKKITKIELILTQNLWFAVVLKI